MQRHIFLETPDQLLTEAELAVKLGICKRTVVTRRKKGELPHIRVGHLIRYSWPDVVEHLRKTSSH